MGRAPANEEGTLHLYVGALPAAEAAELKSLVEEALETQTGSGRNTTRKPVASFNPEDYKPSQMGAVITSGDSEGVTRGVQRRSDLLETAKAGGNAETIASARAALKRQQNVAADRPALKK